MRTLSGIQASGKLHLGNYFGALRQFVQLQGTGETLFFIADLHALTTLRDGPTLRANSMDVALDYLAFGLDPEQSVIFRQSDVKQHAELAWVLSTVAPMGLLERAHSYKDKIAHGKTPEVGLFTYPVLMAADILLYAADRVPTGQDQKQHLEITRDLCTKFNTFYVPGYDPQDPAGATSGARGILTLPEPHILENVAVIPGIDGQKMSKSYDNAIELFAPEKALRKRIMSIVTDSTPVESPKPTPSTVLTLLDLLAQPAEAAELKATWAAGGQGYGHYKKRLADLFFETFGPARARREDLAKNLDYVQDVLRQGAGRARALAAPTWNAVVRATGVGAPIDA